MEDIFIARQPIYDHSLELLGYELLYRDGDRDGVYIDPKDGALASSRLIINTFLSIGLEEIVGSNPAFINLSADFFIEEQPIPMSPEQVVLEVPSNILNNTTVKEGLPRLAAQGYAISLDDFIYDEAYAPLLDMVAYIKLDLSMFDKENLTEQVRQCRRHGVKLLAEKVETTADLELCQELGFDAYQGYFFSHPNIIRGRSSSCDRTVVQIVLDQLQAANTDVDELARVVTHDVNLSFKLLRYINCANYSLRREIDSLREALTLIGLDALKKWAMLILMANYNDSSPRELNTISIVRAHMCEELARRGGLNPHQAFTAGLLSTLEEVMDTPMVELLDSVTLSVPIKLALDNYEGALGRLLHQVVSYNEGQWDTLDTAPLSHKDFAEAYHAAALWLDRSRALAS